MKKRTVTVLKWIGTVIIALALCYMVLLVLASRSLRRAYAALEADGRPMKAEQIIPPMIPDTDNAALVYQSVILQLKSEKAGEKDLFTELGSAADIVLKETTNVEAKAQFRLLSQTPVASEALETLRKGTEKPGCRFDLAYTSAAFVECPHILELRNLSRILCALARQQADDGAHDLAWQTTLCCFRLANAPRDEPLLVTQLVRAALFSLANDTLHALAEKSNPSRQQIEALEGVLRDFEDMDHFVTSLDGERLLMGERAFNLVASEVQTALFGEPGNERFTFGIRKAIAKAVFSSPLFVYDHAAYLRIMRVFTQDATKPFPLPEAATEKTLRQEMRRYHILTGLIVPAVATCSARIRAMNAGARVTRAGLAALKYRQDKGAFPNGLGDLGMGDLPDPFTGKPLIYQATPTGFILYSVGENLTDDNGTTSKKKRLGDIVWYYPENNPPEAEQNAER